MSELPAALKARVPTLTEVLESPEMPDLGDEPLWTAPIEASPRMEPRPLHPVPLVRPHDAAQAQNGQGAYDEHNPVEAVIASLAPQVEALVSSRLRDVLAPTIQEAVEDAIERCRQPLIEALKVQLREHLEQSLPRPDLQSAGTDTAPADVATAGTPPATPSNAAGLRFP